MKIKLTILAFIFSLHVYGQHSYSEIDSIMMNKKFNCTDVKVLSGEICSIFKTDNERIRAFYYYVIFNIKYDLSTHKDIFESLFPTPEAEKFKIDEANRCVKEKTGVCWDQSNLFHQLCNYANISTQLINGTLRNSEEIPNYPHINHTWNAVKTNEGWKFIDCTIAKVAYNFEYLNAYFLVDPSNFIFNYFPLEKKDQHLIKPVDFDFFKRLNPVSSNFYLFKISKLSPINYIIKNNSSFVNFSFIVNNTSNINSFEILLDEKMVKVVNLNKNKIEFSLQTYGAKFMEIIVVIDDLKSKDQWTTSLIKYKIE